MLSNYPPGTSATDPNAPWNETEPEDAQPTIDDLDGRDLFLSGNWDIGGSLDCYDGRVSFDVPAHYEMAWSDLSDAERDLFEQYAAVVRVFATLYERGLAQDR